MFVLWVVSTCLLAYLSYNYILKTKSRNGPPGPTPWPIIGNLFEMRQASPDPSLIFSNMSKIYGEVFSVKVGMKSTVVATSKEAIDEIFSHEASFGRDLTGTFYDRSFNGKNIGVVMSEGETWEKMRIWTFKTLKDFGFGKTSAMEHYIQDSTNKLFERIDKKSEDANGSAISISSLLGVAIFEIMWQMIVSRLSEEDEKRMKILVETSKKWVECGTFGAGIVHMFPYLRFVFRESVGYNVQMDFFNASNQIAKDLLREVETNLSQTSGSQEPRNFIEAYAQFMSQSGESDKEFYLQNFQLIFQDLFLASTETTTSIMESMILFLILNPQVQAKVYEEILDRSPNGQPLNYSDRKKMIYTQAFILESHRHGRVLQNFVPRRALRDFYYKDYLIKQGTVLMADVYLLYNDEKLWDSPEEFRPERFINEEGELHNFSNIIPFSVGKRNCPGELYGHVLSFLFVTSVVQRYHLSVAKGQPKPRSDMQPSMSFKPYPYEACYVRRN